VTSATTEADHDNAGLSAEERELLSGKRAYGPATFVGAVGTGFCSNAVASVIADGAYALHVVFVDAQTMARDKIAAALGLPLASVIVNGRDIDLEDSIAAAREAMNNLAPGRVEWTNGLTPDGSGWDGLSSFAVGRVVGKLGMQASILVAGNRTDCGAVAKVFSATHGVPCVTYSSSTGDRFIPVKALGYAAASALEVLPPCGASLYLDRVVESGAPLAVWRPRPGVSADSALAQTAAGWALGEGVELRVVGNDWDVVLTQGPFAPEGKLAT